MASSHGFLSLSTASPLGFSETGVFPLSPRGQPSLWMWGSQENKSQYVLLLLLTF